MMMTNKSVIRNVVAFLSTWREKHRDPSDLSAFMEGVCAGREAVKIDCKCGEVIEAFMAGYKVGLNLPCLKNSQKGEKDGQAQVA